MLSRKINLKCIIYLFILLLLLWSKNNAEWRFEAAKQNKLINTHDKDYEFGEMWDSWRYWSLAPCCCLHPFSVLDKIMSLFQRNGEFPLVSLHLEHSQLYQKGFIVHISDYNWTKLTLCPVCVITPSMKCTVDFQRCFSVHLCACMTHH